MLPPRGDPYVRAYDVWEIIQALASGDIDAALAMFPPKQRRLAVGHEPSVVAYNAVMGILHGNKRLLRAIDSELNYSSAPRPIRAVIKGDHDFRAVPPPAQEKHRERDNQQT